MATPLTVGVIGPTGFTGSHISVELLQRGHTVVGISRRPEKLGSHPRYITKPLDVQNVSVARLVEELNGLDVLVSCYAPQPGSVPNLYKTFIEVARCIVLAVREFKHLYFISIGGAGSLNVPGTTLCVVDHPDFLLAYRRAIADSNAHTSYMEERMGPMGVSIRRFHDARKAERLGEATDETRGFIEKHEEEAKSQDFALDFIQAARATFMFFDGNTSFSWSFVSPPPLFRPGTRTGSYEVSVDNIPLVTPQTTENLFEGRMTGISAADLAIAVADEAERKLYKHLHWTASGDLSDDKAAPIIRSIDQIGSA